MLRTLLGWFAGFATVFAASLFVGMAVWFLLVAASSPSDPKFLLVGERLLGLTVLGCVLVMLFIVLLFVQRSGRPYTPPLESVHTVIATMRHRNRRRRFWASVILIVSLVYLCTWGRAVVSPVVAGVLAAGLALIQVGGVAFEYRVRQGLFGTSDFEAREIIHFALDNAGLFSGGLGSRVPDLETKPPGEGVVEMAR